MSGRWQLTGGVLDEDVQLLIHGHLERPVLGVLRLVRVDAAVRLRDERVRDVGHALARARAARAVGQVIRQQDQDAAQEKRGGRFSSDALT